MKSVLKITLVIALSNSPSVSGAECPANQVHLVSIETGREFVVTRVAYEVHYICYEYNAATKKFGRTFGIPSFGDFNTWDRERSRILFDQVPGFQCLKAVQRFIYEGRSSNETLIVEHSILDASPGVQVISFSESAFASRRANSDREYGDLNWLEEGIWDYEVGDTVFELDMLAEEDDWEFSKPLVDPGPLGGGRFVVKSCSS